MRFRDLLYLSAAVILLGTVESTKPRLNFKYAVSGLGETPQGMVLLQLP